MNGVVKFALGLAGLPPQVVADVERAMPGMARLIEAAKQLEPILQQAHPHLEALAPHLAAMLPHLQALLPLLDKALPILKTEYPDIVALLPTAQQIIAFAADKKPAAVVVADASKSQIG